MISEMSTVSTEILTELDNSGSGTANKKQSKKQPKGILKNSNPNATYHKHHHRRKLEDLVAEAEIIPTHTHQSGRHKHHHEHHRHRSSTRHHGEDEEVYNNEKNSKMNRRHKKKHHRHHRHHRSEHESDVNEPAQIRASEDEGLSNIYDCPKVPAIPVASSELTTIDNEALQQLQQFEEVVYDVPRSNPPRKVEKEAIYVNNQNQFENSSQDYDVPRTVTLSTQQQQQIEEQGSNVEYDIPAKIREGSLSTIEEEHQEYDVPKNIHISSLGSSKADSFEEIRDEDDDDDPIGHNSEENLYENQGYCHHSEEERLLKKENIYANDNVSITHSSNSTDSCDRSSGYRSSSSPSIQSTEELYVNESAIGSMEDSTPSPVHSEMIMPPLVQPHCKEIGVGTSGGSLPKPEKTKRSKKHVAKQDKNTMESTKREQERAVAEAIDQEIFKDSRQSKSKAPQPPPTYFNDDQKPEIIPIAQVNTEERKKNFLKMQQQSSQMKGQADNNNADTNTIDKKNSQKDRSVDVYHETVRQRATRNTEAAKDVFIEQLQLAPDQAVKNTKKSSKKKSSSRPTSQKDHINDEELPSVKELRSKFELQNNSSKSVMTLEEPAKKSSSTNPGVKTKSKIDFKKGFNVMSSLTRRSASSVSKSMQNLASSGQQVGLQAATQRKSSSNTEMEFSHFTFAEENHEKIEEQSGAAEDDRSQQQQQQQQSFVQDQSNSDLKPFALHTENLEEEEPLYVNIEPKIRGCSTVLTKETPATAEKKKKKKLEIDEQPVQVQHRARNGGESSLAKKLLQSTQANEEEEPEDELALIGPWNPYKTVAALYQLQDVKEGIADANGQEDNMEMEGYLERLPPGKKKSTIWNSWKRQYFVAKSGLLLVFGDSSRSVLMDRIELFGGRVDYMESTMLGIQDRRGHYVVLRLKDREEADRWHNLLSSHVSHDLAQTFVTPQSIPNDPTIFKQILVVDFGGSSVRAGIVSSLPTLPQLFFPSVMAIGKGHEDEKYFGMDAFAPEVRSRCNLIHPFAPSSNIDKYTVNQIALQGFLEKIFKDLNIDPAEYEIQLVSPRPLNEKTQRQLASLLFDDFGVRAVNMAHQSVQAMYAYNAHSGIVVDLGERMDVIPIVDGYRVSAGVSRAPVGGPQMRQKLQHYLLGRNYSLTTFVDSFVVRSVIENLSYMSRNFDRELERYRRKPEKIDCVLELNAKTKLEMGSERFEAVEGLFKPELWGLDQAGIHVLVHKGIRECSMDVRREMTQSIFLAGGLSQIPGIRERLELELEKLSPANKPRVHASPYRYHASYIGATVHANNTAFKQTKLTREEWIGAGQRLPQPWNLS